LLSNRRSAKPSLGLRDGLGQMQLGMGRIDQGNDAIEDIAVAQFLFDEEGLRHRRGVGQASAFDHQAIESDLPGVQALEQQEQGTGQVAMNAAAYTAVGQGHDLHRLVTQQLAVDACLAELVLDHSNFQAVLGF
jgi:hypothetical protein